MSAVTDSDVFVAIADERRLTADLLASLTSEQLATPSLCGEWSVHDVGAHLVMPLVTPISTFAMAMVRARGHFDAANAAMTARVASRGVDEIVELLRANADNPFTPPGSGPMAPLTDLIVHGQDMRRPLGLSREFDEQSMRAVLDFLASPAATRGFTGKGVLDGLRLEATDLGWVHGRGPVVAGDAEALVLALTGRPIAYPELSGDGVEMLLER